MWVNFYTWYTTVPHHIFEKINVRTCWHTTVIATLFVMCGVDAIANGYQNKYVKYHWDHVYNRIRCVIEEQTQFFFGKDCELYVVGVLGANIKLTYLVLTEHDTTDVTHLENEVSTYCKAHILRSNVFSFGWFILGSYSFCWNIYQLHSASHFNSYCIQLV